MQPAFFVSHGAPDLAIADIPAARFLRDLLQTATRPAGIVMISAHWEAAGVEITTAPDLSTIYDFGGFSQELYTLKYPATTQPWLIDAVDNSLRQNGIQAKRNHKRGLDHGAWIPLLLAVPEAEIPVVQISLSRAYSAQDHFTLGQALSSLSAHNILVIASGALVHNLSKIGREGTPPPDWALEFDDWVDTTLAKRDWAALFEFDRSALGRISHPTPEHFLPLIVAAGVGTGTETEGKMHIRKIHSSYSYGSISMSAWNFSHES